MPVLSGALITASYFNAMQTSIATILGPGGYGATVTSSQVLVGGSITAASWNALRNDINTCRTTQTGSAFTTAQLPIVVTGQLIYASVTNLYETAASTVVANYAGNMVLVSNAFSDTRTKTWTGTIDNEVLVTFATTAAANTFFTNGGDLRLALSQTTNIKVQDALWVYNLSHVGTVIMNNTATTRSGTTGTPAAIGWANLTTTYQTLVSAVNMTGGSSYTAYAVDNLYIYAKKNATGTGIILKVSLTNGDTGTISASTKVTYSLQKRTADATPTFALQGTNNLDT